MVREKYRSKRVNFGRVRERKSEKRDQKRSLNPFPRPRQGGVYLNHSSRRVSNLDLVPLPVLFFPLSPGWSPLPAVSAHLLVLTTINTETRLFFIVSLNLGRSLLCFLQPWRRQAVSSSFHRFIPATISRAPAPTPASW